MPYENGSDEAGSRLRRRMDSEANDEAERQAAERLIQTKEQLRQNRPDLIAYWDNPSIYTGEPSDEAFAGEGTPFGKMGYQRASRESLDAFFPFAALEFDPNLGFIVLDKAIAEAQAQYYGPQKRPWSSYLPGLMLGAGFGSAISAAGAGLGAVGGLGEPIGANAYFAGAGDTPALSGLFGAAARGATAGGINALVADGDFSDVVKGAAIGGISGGAGQYAGGMFPDSPWLSSVARGAAAGVTGAALTGGNIAKSGIVGGITGGLSTIGQPVAPSIADQEYERLQNVQAEMYTPDTASDIDALMASQTMQAPTMAEFAATASPEFQAILAEAGLLTGPLPVISPEVIPTEGQPVEELPVEEKPAQERQVDYGKVAKTLYSIYRSVTGADLPDVPPFERPPQKKDQSDEEYLAEISALALDYLELDVDILIEEGYEPNTQDVLNYIRTFVDDTIVAAFGGVDPSEIEGEPLDNLLRQFHNFSEKEIEALLRALYVRGALGVMSFQEWAADPFTGEREFIGAENAKQPDIAAAKRGHARVLESVARQTPGEARRSIKGMLGRSVDLFGLEAARKARAQDEMLAKYGAYQPIDDEESDLYERRYGARGARRGALPMTSRFWEQFRGR